MISEQYVEDGFLFYSKEDAMKCANEVRKIEYLESRLDYAKPDTVRQIYEKAVSERTFTTQSGICFLKNLRDYLIANNIANAETLAPIPAYDRIEVGLQRKKSQEKEKQKQEKSEGKKSIYHFLITINIALVIAIILMFFISLNSENPNILNYETALQNRYSAWEQNLTKREQAVREKERELNLSKAPSF